MMIMMMIMMFIFSVVTGFQLLLLLTKLTLLRRTMTFVRRGLGRDPDERRQLTIETRMSGCPGRNEEGRAAYDGKLASDG